MPSARTHLDEAGVAHYLRLVNRYAPLDAASERALLLRAQDGDGDAFDRVYNANRPLLVALARQQHNGGLDFMDLVAEGSVALIAAIREYDARRDGTFDTHVIGRLRRALESADLEAEREAS